MKTTEWFPKSIDPVREGVYEVRFATLGYKLYSRWHKGLWRHNSQSMQYAAVAIKVSHFAYANDAMQWRGLAQEPKQ